MSKEVLYILEEASNKGIKIGVKENSLTIRSVSPIDDILLQQIKTNKESILKFLQQRKVNDNTNSKITPQNRELFDRLPMSFGQERLWFLDQLEGSLEYHMPTVLRLEGTLDANVLENSLRTIVSRHEVLRTNLLSEDGAGYQEIVDPESWSLDRVKIVDEEELETILDNYLATSFDLSKDYKLRACLYTLEGERYVLACVLHHIASDGWSKGILIDEFTELYNALQSGREAVLPELALQYSDYSIWQRQYMKGEVLESQLAYWEEKLERTTPLLLPTDYPRPKVQSTAGSNITVELDKELSASLVALCQKEGVTPFMLLLSAFKVLLSRYSGQADICVGSPIANRTQSELEGMIGFFINTLVFRSDLSEDPSFRELLSAVKTTTLEGYDHQLVPFEKVVDRVIKTRDMGMSPLFQVMFVLQNTPEGSDELSMEGVSLSEYEFEGGTSQFDLTLNAIEMEEGIVLDMEYCTDLFDRTTIDRMLGHYRELLANIVGNIEQPIGSMSMLSEQEEHQLLVEFNDTNVEFPQNKTLVDLFEEQVTKTPNAKALVCENKVLTYKELSDLSNQLAHYLIKQGVSRESLVGVVLERSNWLIVSLLGILKAGAGYVPIDTSYPEERKEYIRKDIGSGILIDESFLDAFKVVRTEYSDISPGKLIKVEDIAYVIYTSGSTGQPKGVVIEHVGIVNTVLSQIAKFSVSEKDNCLQFASCSFDASMSEILVSLLSGAGLYIINETLKSDVAYFKDYISRESITIATLPPAYLNLFSVEDLKGLRTLVTAGEAISLGLAKSFSAHYNYVNAYGPTETSICATIFQEEITHLVPIGKPISNTHVYITNSSLNIQPIGVVGELCIGGAGVARGYLNRNELTREKFIDSPFKEGERIYKTGDFARWLPDGNVEFVGRKDDQVKIRGYRIELGEIEHALSQIEKVKSCCVLAKDSVDGTKHLVGYVVIEGGFDKEKLYKELRKGLPEYMVPMFWVELEVMPLTNNGKLDRKALPDPDSSMISAKEYVAPRNQTEEQLAAIWQELLGVERIGIHDNFFELGGHSLLAIAVTSKTNSVFNTDLSLSTLFKYSNISDLSKNMHSTNIEDDTKTVLYLKKTGSNKAIFLAPPMSGTSECYFELAKQFSANQPLYAFQCPGLNGESSVSTSIEEMASTFIAEMKKIDPIGPYRIGGYSFGGLIAYKMAMQLQKSGCHVDELIIFDCNLFVKYNLRQKINENSDVDEVFRDIFVYVIDEFSTNEIDFPALFKAKKTKEEIIAALIKHHSDINEKELRSRIDVITKNFTYDNSIEKENKLDVNITLFKAEFLAQEQMDDSAQDDEGEAFDYNWSQITNKDVVVHLIPADHKSILDSKFLEEICSCLELTDTPVS